MRSHRLYATAKLIEFWPPDFEPMTVTVFANKPLDPLVRECENCKLRAACKPGHYARLDCEETTAQALQPTPKKQSCEQRYTDILTALREHGPMTIYDMMERGVGKYGTLRNRLYELIAQGRIQSTLVPHGKARIAYLSLLEES